MPGILNVAFLWHMHQPYYRDTKTGRYALPWVRLHGIKGYFDMIEAVRRFGGKGVTFNLVPSLLKQLQDLASGGETDHYYLLSRTPAGDLDEAERLLILKHFFSAHHANLVHPYPRYRELLYRRGPRLDEDSLNAAAKRFSTRDLLDLQVWFNLAWFGWAAEEEFPLIRRLKGKDRHFSEEEKNLLLDLQIEVLKQIIPRYRKAWKNGDIDITTTPFYHPILPLIIDNGCAKVSQPGDPMPEREFRRPEDALTQLKEGRKYVKEILGRSPTGLWPSEGSVSPAACELAGKAGFKWLATDENVLYATLPDHPKEKILYRGYLTSKKGPAVFFRDQYLSDAIGFRYSANPPDKSVDDFLAYLNHIADAVGEPDKHIVSVILDGENAWEYFPDGGRGFFEELYWRLQNHDRVRLTTFSDFLKHHPPQDVLPPIFPASWIGGSFRIWIGDPIKNRAWDYLAETAEMLDEAKHKGKAEDDISRAGEWLLAAEGSDWFWWYGKPNSSDFDAEFDRLFRSYLAEVYRQLGEDVPEHLTRPLDETEPAEKILLFPINPVIDGRETNYYEWSGARAVHRDELSGAMAFESTLIERLYYGISNTHFFLRIDADRSFFSRDKLEIIVQFKNALATCVSIRNLSDPQDLLVTWQGEIPPVSLPEAALDAVLEIKVPFANLHVKERTVYVSVIVKQGDLELERWPREGGYPCPVPSEEYLNSNWLV